MTPGADAGETVVAHDFLKEDCDERTVCAEHRAMNRELIALRKQCFKKLGERRGVDGNCLGSHG